VTACNSMFVIMLGSIRRACPCLRRFPDLPYMWNASASVPLGLYGLHSSNTRYVGELVAVVPPEPLATFLVDGSYLPGGVSHVEACSGASWAHRLQKWAHDSRQRRCDGAGAHVIAVVVSFPLGNAVASLAPANSFS
jgi:hypothetical protein